jgi:hypothetical protein
MKVHGELVEWYWKEESKVLGEKSFPVSLFLPNITQGLAWILTRHVTVRGWRLTT